MNDNFSFEQVTYILSPRNNGECIPLISKASWTQNNAHVRPFCTNDFARILDYDTVQTTSPPPDTFLGHLEQGEDREQVTFPKRYCALRGSYIFYFDKDDIDIRDGMVDTTPNAPPLGCIPLEQTVLEFPPGGRGCFREHAKTKEARPQGYEMSIRHRSLVRQYSQYSTRDFTFNHQVQQQGEKKIRRAPAYLVFESLGHRELWANAIRIRADLYRKPVKLLRASEDVVVSPSSGTSERWAELPLCPTISSIPILSHGSSGGDVRGRSSVLAGVTHAENEQLDVDERVLNEWANFNETSHVNQSFESQYEYESPPAEASQLEQCQESIRKEDDFSSGNNNKSLLGNRQRASSRMSIHTSTTKYSATCVAPSTLDQIKESILCPITTEPMKDPVMCCDGHSYEREAIERWLRNNSRSPKTNHTLATKEVTPNHALRSCIEAFIELKDLLDSQDS